LIKKFGTSCNPQKVNSNGDTALICACVNEKEQVSTLLVSTFGKKCNLFQINKKGQMAPIICQEKKMTTTLQHFKHNFEKGCV
jgi:hypothetical protein